MTRLVVFAADLRDIIARTGSRSEIRWGGPADRGALITAGASAALVDWTIENGSSARFAVAEENGRIIGQNIYVTGDSIRPYMWLVVRLRTGQDVFGMGALVVPERRGQRLLPDIKGFAARDFVERGYRRMISLVDARNEASIRAHARVGAVPLATLTRVRIGKLVFVWKGWALHHVRWGPQPFVVTV
jgi:RimJ/RimL family protein N-acetyltransferase